jgi:DNA-binding transcriptional ArsR family regulator
MRYPSDTEIEAKLLEMLTTEWRDIQTLCWHLRRGRWCMPPKKRVERILARLAREGIVERERRGEINRVMYRLAVYIRGCEQ